MTDPVSFDAQIVPMEWGKSVYTVLPLPDAVLEALGNPKRVQGEINDHPVNMAVTRAPVMDCAFLYTGKSLLKHMGIQPGEWLDIRLAPADPTIVDVPGDVTAYIRAKGLSAAWNALSPGKQRGLQQGVNSAKRADTRARRIAALGATLHKPAADPEP